MSAERNAMQRKEGGVLLLVVAAVLAFIVLSSGFFKMHQQDAVETVYVSQTKQAFWAAEAGLEDALQRLHHPDFYDAVKGASVSFSVSNAVAVYDVTISDEGTGDLDAGSYNLRILSTGYDLRRMLNRRILQRVESWPGFESVIQATNEIILDSNTDVDGIVMGLPGAELTLNDNNNNLYNTIALADSATVNDGSGAVRENEDYQIVDLPIPDSIPPMPDYSGFYRDATNAVPVAVDSITLDPSSLAPGTHYYNSTNLTITAAIPESVHIVNTGNIAMDGSVAEVNGQNVALFAFGDLTVDDHWSFGGDSFFYAEEAVVLGNHVSIAGDSAVFSHGTAGITIGHQGEIYGVIFADNGNVEVLSGAQGTRIFGTIISGDTAHLGSNSSIEYDPDSFYDGPYLGELRDLLDGFLDEAGVVVHVMSWQELPPL